MKKISSSQFVVLLFITRAFLSVTYGHRDNSLNSVLSMLSTLVSIAVQALMIIPPLAVCAKYPDRDFLQVSFSRSKVLGTVLSLVYGVYFILEACRTMGVFIYFLKNEFLDFVPVWILVIALAGVCFYGAKMGIQTLARTAFLSIGMFAAVFFIIIFGVTGKMDIYNLQLAEPVSQKPLIAFAKDVLNKLAASSELVVLPFILPYVKSQRTSSAFSFLGIKLVVTELMIFYSTAILGEYAKNTSLPFYALSAYAKTSIIERYDSIYMAVWTVGTFIKTAVLMFFAAKCIKNTGFSLGDLAAGIIPTVITLTAAVLNNWDTVFFRKPNGIAVIILVSVIPLAFCFDFRKISAVNKKSERNIGGYD